MAQPDGGKSNDTSRFAQLQMVGLKTPRPPLVLRLPKLLIGSAEGAQIRLKSSTIDRLHAELIPSAGGCLLRDLASSSGTFVNDVPVHEAQLKEGDQIRVGRFVFRYAAPAAKEGAAKVAKKVVGKVPATAPKTPPPSSPRSEVKSKVEKLPAERIEPPAVEPAQPPASFEKPTSGSEKRRPAAIATVVPVPVLKESSPPVVAETVDRQPPLVIVPRTSPEPAAVIERPAKIPDEAPPLAPDIAAGVREIHEPETKPAPPDEAESPAARASGQALESQAASSAEESALARVVSPASQTVRFRPVVGRRRRPRRQQGVVAPMEAQTPVAEAGDAAVDEQSDEELLEPQTARGKAAGYFLLMLVCMAVAAVLAWRYSPPLYIIRASITFQSRSGEPLAKNQTYLDQQKAKFLSDQTRAAAVKLLAHSKDHSTDNLDPGFLTDPSGLLAVGSVSWEAAAGRPSVMSLVYTLRSRLPQTDTARATALIRAFTETRGSSTKPGAGDLKMRLLQAELDDLEREVAFRSHSPDQIRRQIEILENATPSEVEMNLMQKREASLRAAVESAMQDRIVAQLGATNQHRSATAPSPSAITQAAADPGSQQLVEKLRQQEASLQAEWHKALRDLAEAKVRSQWLAEQKTKITNAQRDLPALKDKLKQKSAELAEMKKINAGVDIFALDDARVVEVQDQRGMHVGVAVAGVAILFGLLMITAAQGRVVAPDQAGR